MRLWAHIKEALDKLKRNRYWVGILSGFIFGFISIFLFFPDQFGTPPKPAIERGGLKKTMKLRPLGYKEIPHWQRDDHLAAFNAFKISCRHFLSKPKTGNRLRQRKRLKICRIALSANINHKTAARQFFERHFRPYRILTMNSLLTGYYEPELEGAREPDEIYKIPVYKRPDDLVSLINDRQRAAKNHQFTFMRRVGNKLQPYPSRQEIEQGALSGKGLELLYLKDQVDAFFMHIQGSGRIRLKDGRYIRIGYDGKNGHPYRSIGKHLKRAYKFKGEQLRLNAVKNWLRTNKELGQKVMWHNKSYIFFRELDNALGATGPIGAEGVNLSARRSLAVDGSYHQLGMPIWLDVGSLSHHGKRGFHHLMIGQDVGSAIKGPARGDIYWGSGEFAGQLAGGTNHRGRFTVLLPR